MVETHAISKLFRNKKDGDKLAVDGVSIQCLPGEVYGLLGANGAGKTTLLRMLATMLEPTSGTAVIQGYDVRRQPGDVRRVIGFMSASTALYGRLTAREMIAYFGTLYGMGGDNLKKRINELIDKFDIGEFASRLCDRLSSGQKQRVSIARTIVHDPPVLFLDEPTAGLDVLAARNISDFIMEARQARKTIVFSTHIMSEVERLCDRVGVIHNGRTVTVGTIDDLRKETGEEKLEDMFLKLVGAHEPTEVKA